MHDPISNRHALEEFWRVRLEEARLAYELARNSLREVRQQFGSEPNADGTHSTPIRTRREQGAHRVFEGPPYIH